MGRFLLGAYVSTIAISDTARAQNEKSKTARSVSSSKEELELFVSKHRYSYLLVFLVDVGFDWPHVG